MTHIWVFSWVRSKLIHRPLSTLTRHFKSILHRSLSPHIGCFHTRGHRLLSTHIGHFSFKKQPILHRPLCTKHRPLSYKHRLLWLNIGRFDIGHFHTNIGRFSSTSAAFNCTRFTTMINTVINIFKLSTTPFIFNIHRDTVSRTLESSHRLLSH